MTGEWFAKGRAEASLARLRLLHSATGKIEKEGAECDLSGDLKNGILSLEGSSLL